MSTFVTTVAILLLAGKAFSADGTVSVQRAVQDNVVLAKAYQCDANLDEIVSNDPVEKGSKIRICVATHLRAKFRGIYITKIVNFHFLKEEDDRATIEQILLQNGIETNDKTLFTCQPGSDLCYFESIPSDDFFAIDGTVLAIGNIIMQYGKYESRLDTNSLRGSNRKMMDTMELLDTMTTVEMSFSVGDGLDGPSRLARDFREHWENSPDYVKALYIAALVFALLILAGVCTGLCLWASCCSHIKTIEKEDDEKFPPSVSKDDHSGTFVGDEDSDYVGPGSPPNKTHTSESKAKPKQVYVRRHASGSVRGSPRKNSTDGSKRKLRQVPVGTRDSGGSPRKSNLGRRQSKPRQTPVGKRNFGGFVSRSPRSVKKVERKRTPRTAYVGRNDSGAIIGDLPKRKQHEDGKRVKKPGSMRWLDEKNKMEGSTHSALGPPCKKEGTPSPTSKHEADESRNKRASTTRKVRFAMEPPLSEKEAEMMRNPRPVN
jgi:hypothetical protein